MARASVFSEELSERAVVNGRGQSDRRHVVGPLGRQLEALAVEEVVARLEADHTRLQMAPHVVCERDLSVEGVSESRDST